MANYGNHTLHIFQDDKDTVKEYLKIAINIIFYHRCLNNNNFILEKSIINDISYFKIDSDIIEKEMNNIYEKIDNDCEFYCDDDNVKNHNSNQYKFQITLNFYTKMVTQFYFFSKPEGLWEKWNFLVIITDKSTENEDKENKIRKFISIILKELNSEKNFMPDINLDDCENFNEKNNATKSEDYFPFELKIGNDFEQESMIAIFNKMNIKGSFNRMI